MEKLCFRDCSRHSYVEKQIPWCVIKIKKCVNLLKYEKGIASTQKFIEKSNFDCLIFCIKNIEYKIKA